MTAQWTEADFDKLSWHDCYVWSVELRAQRSENRLADELALGLDFITECIRGTAGIAQFRLAPAILVFQGVSDAVMTIESKDSRLRLPRSGAAISSITREHTRDRVLGEETPSYSWRITFTWPSGDIRFGARGFTQTLLAAPVLTYRDRFSESERRALLAARS